MRSTSLRTWASTIAGRWASSQSLSIGRSSWRASKEFRLQLVSELAKRAVRQATLNAGGELDV